LRKEKQEKRKVWKRRKKGGGSFHKKSLITLRDGPVSSRDNVEGENRKMCMEHGRRKKKRGHLKVWRMVYLAKINRRELFGGLSTGGLTECGILRKEDPACQGREKNHRSFGAKRKMKIKKSLLPRRLP